MTTLVRWTPRIPTVRAFERLFDDLGRDVRPAGFESDTARPVVRPAMDVVETESGYEIRVDLPGLSPDDLNVQIEDGVLTISGERENTVEDETERYTYRERRYGAFKRNLRLGEVVDSLNITAAFENGVLTLSLPKRPEAQPTRIEVKTV